MTNLLKRRRPDLLALLLLFLLPLGLFWRVTLGGRTLLPADNLFAFEPWRSARAELGVTSPHNELLSDLVLENYPWKRFIVQSLRAGEAPLWNPYLFAGAPFLATGQHSALYPFSVLFYLPGMPAPQVYGAFIVSQLFLAGAFNYAFLRALIGRGPGGQARRLGPLLGGIAYQLCLFMVVSAVFPMIVAGAAWLPLFLLALEWIVVQRPVYGRPATLPWVGLGAVALGCVTLAGHPEILYYTLLVGGAYSAWRLGAELLRGGDGTGPSSPFFWRKRAGDGGRGGSSLRSLALRPAAYLLMTVALGLGLGAAQLIPLAEAAQGNFRTGSATFEQVLGWGYPPRHAAAFFVPNVFGNPSHHAYFDLFAWRWTAATVNSLGQPIEKIDWGPPITNYVEGGAYVGLLTLMLAAVGIGHYLAGLIRAKSQIPDPKSESGQNGLQITEPRGPAYAERGAGHALRLTPVPFFALLGLLSLAFAFGTPLYALIFWLPGINQLHSPFRWVWVLALCLSALAAFGAAALQAEAGAKGNAGTGRIAGRRLSSLSSLIAFVSIAGGAAALAGLVMARAFWPRFEPGMERVFQGLAVAPQAFADVRMFFSYEAWQVLVFALLLVASGIVLRLSRCAIYLPAWLGGRPVWEALAVGVLALDLLAAGAGFNPAADPKLLDYTPPVVEFLRGDRSLWRFTTYDPDGRKPFNANTGWYFDFQDARGYDSIIPRQYAEYMALIEPQGELQFNRIAPISNPQSLDSPLLDLLNVKYVISLAEIDSPKYRLVYNAEVKVYENLGVVPRAFTLPRSAVIRTDDFGRAIQTYDPRQYVVLDGQAEPGGRPAPGTLQAAVVAAYGQNEVTVEAQVAEPAVLVLADSYAAGWRAFVRPAGASATAEQETPILRADGNFRGVQLGPGTWSVRFKYSPMSVRLGAFLSLISAMALALAVGVWLWRWFYREAALDSTARRVAKNSLAPMALNLFNRAIDLVFAAFMLRILGPGDAGKYYFAAVIIVWFDTFAGFGLNTFLTREAARDPAGANRYLANTTLLRLVLGGGAGLLLGALVYGWWRWFGLAGDTALAIILLAVGLLPSSLSAGLTALFQAYEKHEFPAAVTTVTTFLKVGVGAAALVAGYGFVGLAASSIVVNVATLLILGGLTARLLFQPRFRGAYDHALQGRMLRESSPLMINNLLAGLFFKVDVALLEPIRNAREAGLGSREVGWYSTAYKFVEAFNVVPSLFTFALFPVMARQAQEDREALARSYGLAVKLLFCVAAPLAAVTTFLARVLIGGLGGAEFLPHGAIALQLMIWSIPFGWINSVTNYLLIALGRQRSLTAAFFIGLTFNVAANLIFLPRYGYPAAAIITILSELVEGIPFYLALRRALKPVPWLRLLWKPALSTAAMAGLMAGLWPARPGLALLAGLAAYLALAAALRVFEPEEWATLTDILPARLRRRLAPENP